MTFAVVVLLPETTPDRADFAAREFENWSEFAEFMEEMEGHTPGWRVVSVCHIEDLPLFMEPPQ